MPISPFIQILSRSSHFMSFVATDMTRTATARDKRSFRLKHSQSLWRTELQQSPRVAFETVDMPDSNIAAAAAAINALQAHAAVHLDGHNGDSFIAAFALHPAPLQVLSHGNRDPLQSTLAAATSHADIAACSPPHHMLISPPVLLRCSCTTGSSQLQRQRFSLYTSPTLSLRPWSTCRRSCARTRKLSPALLLQNNGFFFNRFSSVLFTEKLILLPPSYLPNQVASLISSFLHCTGTAVSVAACLQEHRCYTSLCSAPPTIPAVSVLISGTGTPLLHASASPHLPLFSPRFPALPKSTLAPSKPGSQRCTLPATPCCCSLISTLRGLRPCKLLPLPRE